MSSGNHLIGREPEQIEIAAAWRSHRPEACGILIVGEPGIGKTALLAAALEEAADQHSRIIRIGFTRAEADVAWAGLAAFVDDLPRAWVTRLPAAQRHAVQVALGAREPNDTDVTGLVAAAVRTLLRRATDDGPAILAIDDLQWTDAGTAGAFSSAIRACSRAPLVVVAALRSNEIAPIDLPRLLGNSVTIVHLDHLTRVDVHEMLRRRDVVVTPPILDDVFSLGSGNPLHTVMLIDQIKASGWRRGALPPSIAHAHHSTVDALDRDAQVVLEFAAVLDEVDSQLIGQCLSTVDTAGAIESAEHAGLIVSDRAGRAVFAHPTIPAAILGRLGPTTTAKIHRQLGEHLPSDDERAAVHLAASTSVPDDEIALALERVAARALERGAKQTAAQRFLRAAELTPPSEADDRWRRIASAADAFLGAGDLSAAEAPSIEACATAVDPAQVAVAGGIRVQIMASHGDIVPAHRFIVDLLDHHDQPADTRALLGRGRVRLEQLIDLSLADATAASMRDEMITAELPTHALEFEIAHRHARFLQGEPTDVVGLWQLAEPIIDAVDYLSSSWMALEALTWSGVDDNLAQQALDRFERAARSAGAAQSIVKLHDFRGNLLIRRGALGEGEAELRIAADEADLTEMPGDMSRSALALLLAATGRLAEAKATAMRCPTATGGDELPLLVAVHQSCLGFIDLCHGRNDAAANALSLAWAAAEQVNLRDLTSLPFRTDLVEALTNCNRVPEAVVRSRYIRELAQHSELPLALVQAARADVLVAAARGDLDGAIAAASEGLEWHGTVRYPLEFGRLQLAHGSALRRAGRRRAAEAALSEALATFEQLGAVPFLARAHAELDRMGRHAGIDAVLTPTEEQIAARVSAGRSNNEVAGELVVSVRTVESNLTRVYRKLGVRNRAELAALFRSNRR